MHKKSCSFIAFSLSFMMGLSLLTPITANAEEIDRDLEKFQNAEEFVVQMYKNSGKTDYTQMDIKNDIILLQKGEITGTDIAKKLCYRENVSNRDFIKDCYRVLENHDPSEEQIGKWEEKLDKGFSKDAVFADVTNSEKYKETCDEHNTPHDVFIDTNYRDVDENITDYANNILSFSNRRDPSSSEMEELCQKMIEDGDYVSATIDTISNSEAVNLEPEEFVSGLFDIYEENISKEEKADIVNNMNDGKLSYDDVVSEFCESDKFLSTFKIKYTDIIYIGDGTSQATDIAEEDIFYNKLSSLTGIPVTTYINKGCAFTKNNITDNILNTIDTIPENDNYSIVFVEAGLNDWVIGSSIREGEANDTTILYGAVNTAINNIKAKMPNAEIYVLSPYKCIYSEEIDSLALTLDTYIGFIKNGVNDTQATFIDIYEDPDLDFTKNMNKYLSGGIYLTKDGNAALFDRLKGYVTKENIPDDEANQDIEQDKAQAPTQDEETKKNDNISSEEKNKTNNNNKEIDTKDKKKDEPMFIIAD